MTSNQALDDPQRRVVARWAAACAGRVAPLFVADPVAEEQIRDALARTLAYAGGGSTAAEEITKRMIAVKAAGAATTPAGAASARSVAQASAVAHMGAHALGAAAYAVKAVTVAEGETVGRAELAWQLAELTLEEREVLGLLPHLGTDSGGPLGPGLLSRGILGDVIREIQAALRG